MGHVAAEQQRLFDPAPYTAERDYAPESWVHNPDVVYHGTQDVHPHHPEAHHPIHVGTYDAAEERGIRGLGVPTDEWNVHPYRISGQFKLAPNQFYRRPFGDQPGRFEYPTPNQFQQFHGSPKSIVTDDEANGWGERVVRQRGMNVPYVNEAEDAGSVSYVAPRKNLHTWSEDVQADPNAPTKLKAIAESHDLVLAPPEPVQPWEGDHAYVQGTLDGSPSVLMNPGKDAQPEPVFVPKMLGKQFR